MRIYLERIYDPPMHAGYRVLADRLWPRGMTKARAGIDEWNKVLAPTSELRRWFAHAPEKWDDFSLRYTQEISEKKDAAQDLLHRAGRGPLVLLTGTKNMAHTHVIILRSFLMTL